MSKTDHVFYWHRPNPKQREIHRRIGKRLKYQFGYETFGALVVGVIEFMEIHYGRVSNVQLRQAFENFRRQPKLIPKIMDDVNSYMQLWEGTCITRAEQSRVKGESRVFYYQWSSDGRQTLMSGNARVLDALKRMRTFGEREAIVLEEHGRAGHLEPAVEEDYSKLKHVFDAVLAGANVYVRMAESMGLLNDAQSAKPTDEDMNYSVPEDEVTGRRSKEAMDRLAKAIEAFPSANDNLPDDDDDGDNS